MYIVNKEQKHPQSHFKILSPTANVAARGTQGYLSVSQLKTLVANQAGFIRALNADPTVIGDVMVGPMMKTVIEEAYYILHFTSKAESCAVPVEAIAYTNLHGMIKFTNENGRVFAEVVG